VVTLISYISILLILVIKLFVKVYLSIYGKVYLLILLTSAVCLHLRSP